MDINSGFAAVNGGLFYYEVAGSGHPLVFIHGFSFDTRMWDDQFELFAQRYTAIRYDLRGFGKSSVPGEEPYVHAADLKAVLDFLGFAPEGYPVYIVALSLGSAIALEFALAYPQSTDALVLLDSVLWGHEWEPVADPERSAWRLGRTHGVEAARTAWLEDPMFKPAIENPEVAPRLSEMIAEFSGWTWIKPDPGVYPDPPTSKRLHEITAPTLVIVGERDLSDFQTIADTLASDLPNATKLVIPGVGHMSNMEDPQTVNRAVLDFLASVSAKC